MFIKRQNYNGNSNLKSSGVKIKFTVHQAMEYMKCQDDYVYFIKNYCKVVSLDKGLIPFNLFSFQEEFLQSIDNNRFVIGMLARQMGKTQTVAAYILWYVIFNDNKNCAILAHKAKGSREVLSRVKDMFEMLPAWIQQGVKTWNKGDIELENGSKVFCDSTSSTGIRGKSVNFLYMDEAAMIPNNIAEEFFASTYPTISSGNTTKVVITSTPLGYNHFWKMWNEAINKTSEFVNFYAPWTVHPNRDEKWAREQRNNLGELRYQQEVECSFLGSSLTLLSSSKLASLVVSAPVKNTDNMKVYEYPKQNGSYVLICDPSEGIGIDYSTFTVIDITSVPYRVVAVYRDNKISPQILPNIIHKVATYYNSAHILCEINRGELVASILHNELEYDNILFTVKGKTGQEVSAGFGGAKPRLGVITDKRVKRLGCSTLKELVENDKLLFCDADIVSELSTFIEKRGSFAADEGYHDDLVMTLVLFSWATTCSYFKELNDNSKRESLFKDMINRAEEELTPFGFIVDGTEDDSRPLNF